MSEYEELYEEIKLKNSIEVEGLSFVPEVFDHANSGTGTVFLDSVNLMFAPDKEEHKGRLFPVCFYSPKGGYHVPIRWDRKSRYELVYENGKYNINDRFDNKRVYEGIHFRNQPKFYTKRTSDGRSMKSIANDSGFGALFICYSNECSLKDKGEDCLFCNINATKALYGEEAGIEWKTAPQIAETVKEAYSEGWNHLTVSGGFVPERREVDYYLDVAETIRDYLDSDSFNGTACIGAPTDFSVFPKYKEAGFSTIATNMEIWNAKVFDYICPGKSKQCGGHDRWLDALKEEVEVFGRYNVRSTFVAGLETKESLLEGISTLAELGVIGEPSSWNVNVGSALQGHRTPEPEWHWEVQERAAEIYINNDIPWENIRNASAGVTAVSQDLYRLKQGIRIDGNGREIRPEQESLAS